MKLLCSRCSKKRRHRQTDRYCRPCRAAYMRQWRANRVFISKIRYRELIERRI
jgi:hypothetical protein